MRAIHAIDRNEVKNIFCRMIPSVSKHCKGLLEKSSFQFSSFLHLLFAFTVHTEAERIAGS